LRDMPRFRGYSAESEATLTAYTYHATMVKDSMSISRDSLEKEAWSTWLRLWPMCHVNAPGYDAGAVET